MANNTVLTASAVRAFIDQNRVSFFQWKVIAICFFIVMLDGFDISIVAYIAPAIKKEMTLAPDSLSYLFVAGAFGLMLGSMIFGPLADKWGRKRILILSTLLYGAGSLLCGLTTEFSWLVFFRLLTGIGLGGAMPVSITLCSEYSPQRHRMMLCTLSWSGFTVGIAIGGVIANWVLQHLSWNWLFYLGGMLPILCIPLIAFGLPESLDCLLKRNSTRSRAALQKILHAINPRGDRPTAVPTASQNQPATQQTIMALFSRGYGTITLLLWLSFFCSLFVFYLLTYWLPIIFDGIYDYQKVNYLTAMLPLGGTIGALLLALLIDYKKEAFTILASTYFIAVGLLLLISHFVQHYYGLLMIVFMIGFTIAGAQNGLNLISATLYPGYARATGVSWAMASGRCGSIVGSFSGAWLLADEDISLLFHPLAAATLICSLALVVIFLLRRGKSRATQTQRVPG